MDRDKALKDFRDYVIRESRKNLTRMKKNSSKKLYNSIKDDIKVMPNSIRLSFDMEPYGKFQDRGVSGKKKKYDTPYKYTNDMPPPKAFDKWIVRKGLAGRDDKGKFKSRKSLQFMIARSIFNNGIKPSLFFTKAFNKGFKRLPEELVESYGLEAENLLAAIFDRR